MSVHVNTVSISASATSASAYSATIPAGTGIIAGDVLIVNAISDGTHASNGISVQDSVNTTNFTTISEKQLGGVSSSWQQTFYYAAAANIPDGSLITLTPYGSATHTAFTVDIFRYALATIVNAVTTSNHTAATSQTAPALGAAPVLGSLVLTFDASTAGNLTPGSPFTMGAGSAVNGTGASAATAFATADGVTTYASTWTDSSSAVSAQQTVAFKNAGVGVPYLVGSTSQAAGSASTVINVTTTTIAHDALFLAVGNSSYGAITPTQVTDTKGHAWSLIGSVLAANGTSNWVYESLNATTPLVSGSDTITVTWSATGYAKNCLALGCAGVNQTAALDQTASAVGVGSGPTVTTASSLANNNELAIAVLTSGNASAGVSWTPAWTDLSSGGLHNGSSVYTSVATQVIISSTSPVTAAATLGGSAVFAELLLMILPDPPSGPSATVTVTTTSPLPNGTPGTNYSDTLTATGGTGPYTWARTSGSLPPGLSLSAGSHGGGSSNITYAGFTSGATGSTGLTEANWATDYHKFLGSGSNGTNLCAKMFFAGGNSAVLPATWAATSGSTGPAVDIVNAFPGFVPMLCWNAPTSPATGYPVACTAAAITAFCNSIPAGQVCMFSWQSEQENGGISSQFFQGNSANIFNAIHASKNSANLYLIPTSYIGTGSPYWPGGSMSSAFITPPGVTDAYGVDAYYHLGSPPATGLQDHAPFQNWLSLVKNQGRPLALGEYGVDIWNNKNPGSPFSAALRAQYIQNDINWINNNFNNQGTKVSASPLAFWMYWDRWTKGPNSGPEYGPLTDTGSSGGVTVWTSLLNQVQAGTGGGSPGGIISGIPTTAGTYTFFVTATDANNNVSNPPTSLTLTIQASSLNITTTSLDNATQGNAYSATLNASGGQAPYTWSLFSGSLPTGMNPLSAAGLISGTPTVGGTTFNFTVQVTDSAAATDTQALSITVSNSLNIVSTTLPPATQNVPYTATLLAANGTLPYNWTLILGTLPTGLSFDQPSGTISGTPTVSGPFNLTFQVSDAAGATDTQALTLTVASATGGLPAVGRRGFGGDEASWTFAFSGNNLVRAAGVPVTFWTALTGGAQFTDLTDAGGNPITQVTTDSNGRIPAFFGPSGIWIMAADANAGGGPRQWIFASDMGAEIQILYNALATIVGTQ